MTASEANRQRVLALVVVEDRLMSTQFNLVDKRSPAIRRGEPIMSEFRRLSFFDRRDRIRLNDF
jgi:hypothetical protein